MHSEDEDLLNSDVEEQNESTEPYLDNSVTVIVDHMEEEEMSDEEEHVIRKGVF